MYWSMQEQLQLLCNQATLEDSQPCLDLDRQHDLLKNILYMTWFYFVMVDGHGNGRGRLSRLLQSWRVDSQPVVTSYDVIDSS